MSLKVTPGVMQKLEDVRKASDRLHKAVKEHPGTWTPAQEEQLGEIYDCIKGTADALIRLVNANS